MVSKRDAAAHAAIELADKPAKTASEGGGSARSRTRPAHLDLPEWPESPPVPEPRAGDRKQQSGEADRDPTRYGDWEHKGIAVDF
jgi:hypothetical protein